MNNNEILGSMPMTDGALSANDESPRNDSIVIDFIKNELGEEYEINYIGERESSLYYKAYIPQSKTGFPIVIIAFENKLNTLAGFDALDTIASFNKI